MEDAFIHLRKSLVGVCMLTVPKHDDVFTLHTDASLMGVGGVLNVFRADEEMPVGFYARQLRKVELNYSAMELQALAVTHAVEHFAHYLYGRDFTIWTDHRAQEELLNMHSFHYGETEFGLPSHHCAYCC